MFVHASGNDFTHGSGTAISQAIGSSAGNEYLIAYSYGWRLSLISSYLWSPLTK